MLKLFKEENLVFTLQRHIKVAFCFSELTSVFTWLQFHTTHHAAKKKRNKTWNVQLLCFALRNWKNWKINMFYQYLHAFLYVVNTILHFTSSPLSARIDAEKTGLMDSREKKIVLLYRLWKPHVNNRLRTLWIEKKMLQQNTNTCNALLSCNFIKLWLMHVLCIVWWLWVWTFEKLFLLNRRWRRLEGSLKNWRRLKGIKNAELVG